MRVMVVNAGSTGLKLRVVQADDRVGAAENLEPGDMDGLERFVRGAGPVGAVGHRVVHGGPHFREPALIDDSVRRTLEDLNEVAPLHNPPALRAMDDLGTVLPGVPAVACFDTGFHASLPEEAWRYALPEEWVRRWGIRRYGFHGLSCEWALERAAALLGVDPGRLRLVICHLGGGASVTAVAGGRSVDTTMGFTPTEGLVMATRSGDVDPGLIAWMAERGVSPEDLIAGLEERSGLLALSGGETADMRELLERRRRGSVTAGRAVSVFLHRLAAKVAAMAASAGGVDALVFTGGIGEHSVEIRAEAAERLSWMGVRIDAGANSEAGSEDADITSEGAAVATLVVPAREEVVVARAARRLLSSEETAPVSPRADRASRP